MPTTMVHVRIRKEVKVKTERALEVLDMSISDAVRILLVRVAVDKAFPFSLQVPNATTRKAMCELHQGQGQRSKNAKELLRDLGI
jgi:DNA-damage-inducible protein J